MVRTSWRLQQDQGRCNSPDAYETAGDYDFAGYDDWRVPNIKELSSIVEERCFGPAINLQVFPAMPGGSFWSSSPGADYSDDAWHVNFDYGGTNSYYRYYSQRLRLVRSGQ